MDPRADGCFHDFAVGGVWPSVADILHDSAGKEKDVLLYDADVPAKTLLSEIPDIISVHCYTAAGDVVEARDQVAHGCLTAAGFAHQRDCLAGCDAQIDVVEDLCPVVVGEGDILEADIALDVGQCFGIRGVLDLGLGSHQFHEALKTRHSLRVNLHELHKLADWRCKSRDVKGESDEVDVVHPFAHDQKTARGDDGDLHQADCGLDARIEEAHGAVEGYFACFEGLVGLVELRVLRLLVGKSLRGSDTGNAALDGGVDLADALFDLTVGGLHVQALAHAENDTGGQHDYEDQGQQRVDRQQNDERTDDGDGAGKDVLGTVVGEFYDLEQIVGDAGEQYAGPVPVEETVRQRLHMREHVSPHVCLDQGSHPVSDHRDKILAHRAQYIRREHNRHHDEKCPKYSFGQQVAHRPSRHIRKDQVHNSNSDGQRHINGEGFPVGHYIGGENRQFGAGVVFFHF